MASVRTVTTSSGATAVQIIYSRHHGKTDLEHVGSAHTVEQVAWLKEVARQRIAAFELGRGIQDMLPVDGHRPTPTVMTPAIIVATVLEHLWTGLELAYRMVGLDRAAGFDDVFKQLVIARIVEPTSKYDSIRVLQGIGVQPPSYATIKRRLAGYAGQDFQAGLTRACVAYAQVTHASLLLYDVTTLWFEVDRSDALRIPGFSKERRIDPQITVGLLTDQWGFPLLIDVFKGNEGETTTIIPVVEKYLRMVGGGKENLTVVADAGMFSSQNLKDLEEDHYRFIVGGRIPKPSYQILAWHRQHPCDHQDGADCRDGAHWAAKPIPDGLVLKQYPMAKGSTKAHQRLWTEFFCYKHDRAMRNLHAIDQQVSKAERVVAGEKGLGVCRFVTVTDSVKTVNQDLVSNARGLAGWKSYVTNIVDPDPATIIAAYHDLWHIEHGFRMSKHDLAARPIYHRLEDSIRAHLAIVFAALAVAKHVEATTGWSIRELLHQVTPIKTVTINAGGHLLTASDPVSQDTATRLARIGGPRPVPVVAPPAPSRPDPT